VVTPLASVSAATFAGHLILFHCRLPEKAWNQRLLLAARCGNVTKDVGVATPTAGVGGNTILLRAGISCGGGDSGVLLKRARCAPGGISVPYLAEMKTWLC